MPRIILSLARGAIAGLLSVSGTGCMSQHFGDFPDGLSDFPDRTVTPAAAVEAAEPYLDQSFRLCRAGRGSDWPATEPSIRIKLEGRYYYILKDNYPAKNANSGFSHAVKVNATTGEIEPPR